MPNKVISIDDFVKCVVKIKILLRHSTPGQINAMDKWTLRSLL